jgi:hypothetical protein
VRHLNSTNLYARKSSDILLDLFLEKNLGGIDHELDDWTDGITDPLHEEYADIQPAKRWDYFRGTANREHCAELFILAADSRVVRFPAHEKNALLLSA